MLLLVGSIAVFGWVVVSFFLGNPEKSDPLGLTNYFLSNVVPTNFQQVVRLLFGDRGFRAIKAVVDYVFWKPNPILQIAYIGLMTGAYGLAVYHIFPMVPTVYIGAWHRYVVSGLILLCMYLYYKACTVDPGFITKDTYNRHVASFPHDHVIFAPTRCTTCQHIKPARSKHCRFTNKCVARYDHYCAWLAQPVGEGNHYYFLAYLLANAATLLYAAGCLVLVLASIVAEEDLFNANFVNRRTGVRSKATTWIVVQYLMARQQVATGIFFMATIMGFVVLAFFGYHLSLVAANTTTNETVKWAQASWQRKANRQVLLAVLKEEKRRREAGEVVQPPVPAGVNPVLLDPGKMATEDLMPWLSEIKTWPVDPPTNVYDNGFWRNLGEVLRPCSQRPGAEAAGKAYAVELSKRYSRKGKGENAGAKAK